MWDVWIVNLLCDAMSLEQRATKMKTGVEKEWGNLVSYVNDRINE